MRIPISLYLSCTILFFTACSKSTNSSISTTNHDILPGVDTLIADELWTVTTLAGGSEFADINGTGLDARFVSPNSMIIDKAENLYVNELNTGILRKITKSGVVSTFFDFHDAESEVSAGPAFGVAMDSNSKMYAIVENYIFHIEPSGNYGLVAGSNNGIYADGKGISATFKVIKSITMDQNNNILVTDFAPDNTSRVRKVSPDSMVTTLAMTPEKDVPVGIAEIGFYPLVVDGNGTIYFTINGDRIIEKLTSDGRLSVLAGGNLLPVDGIGAAAGFVGITAMALDPSGNLWVVDWKNNVIRRIKPGGKVETMAGTPAVAGYADGKAKEALFNNPFGIAISPSGVVYIADGLNNRIRKMTKTN